jgi:hypothetical protein
MVPLLWSLRLICFVFGAASFVQIALGQRGADFGTSAGAQQSPGHGFPGLFDARMADAGKFSLEIPTLATDYGVNDQLSVGTNIWALTPLTVGLPVLYAKVRYRFFSTRSINSVNTVYLGGYSNAFSKPKLKSSGVLFGFSNNTSFAVGENGEITSTLLYFQFSSNSQDTETQVYNKISVGGLVAGATYQYWATGWFGPSLMALATPYFSFDSDSSSGAVSAQVTGNNFVILRGSAEFLAGNSWLLSPGIYYVKALSDSSTPAIAFPIFSASVKW